MEIIVILIVLTIGLFLFYQFLAPGLDANKDGKVDEAEVKAAVEEVKAKATTAVKKAKTETTTAVKKVVTRKPRVTKK